MNGAPVVEGRFVLGYRLMAHISIVGAGYVGLVTGACMAKLGHRVRCIDIDVGKVDRLRQGAVPFHEPGLQELVSHNLDSRRISFHSCFAEGLATSEFVFVCVDTPTGPEGKPQMDHLEAAVTTIIRHVERPVTIINKSTVPVGTGNWVQERVAHGGLTGRPSIDIVSCPEFLSEGSAIQNFMHPDRIVLGCLHAEAAQKVAQLFRPLGTEILITDLETAEMIKYASNAYLAARISFVNHVARLCEHIGVDIDDVTRGMSLDRRIGPDFLKAGIGFGGSCLPKDLKALKHLAERLGVDASLLWAILELNQQAHQWVVMEIQDCLGSDLHKARVALWGLTFKPGTDDLREAPALDILAALQTLGAEVTAYDPVALALLQDRYPTLRAEANPYAAAAGTDALVICTEWDEFRGLDMERVAKSMRRRILVDGRNVHDATAMQALGFTYRGVGRGRTRRSDKPESQ